MNLPNNKDFGHCFFFPPSFWWGQLKLFDRFLLCKKKKNLTSEVSRVYWVHSAGARFLYPISLKKKV